MGEMMNVMGNTAKDDVIGLVGREFKRVKKRVK